MKICLRDGESGGVVYIGDTGENMHTRMKSHLTKFNSKKPHITESSAFYKHLENKHGGFQPGSTFDDYFTVEIIKAFNKPLSRQIEEGMFMMNVKGELLNSKQNGPRKSETQYTMQEQSWLEEKLFPSHRMDTQSHGDPVEQVADNSSHD